MGSFIKSLISRHIEHGKKVTPRLRGRFEPMDIAANSLSADLAESRENQVDQIPAHDAGSKGGKDMIKESPGRSIAEIKPVTPFHLDSPEKKDENEDHPETGNQSIRPAIPHRFHPVEEMSGTAPVSMKSMNEPGPVNITQVISPKENPVIIKREGIILNEEPELNREAEKEPDLSSAVLPVISNAPEPLSPGELKMPNGRPGGAFGEPPGAISRQIIRIDEGPANDQQDVMSTSVIKVTIGQINVRAVSPPPPVAAPKPREAQKPSLSLEDYLKQRSKR